jgi:AcrR family transcriptional regulator
MITAPAGGTVFPDAMTVDASSDIDPHGKPAQGVHAHEPSDTSSAQRARILSAARQSLREHPTEQLSIGRVCAAAGMSRAMLVRSFCNRDELLLATFDDIAAQTGAAMAIARKGEATWLDGVRAALIELLYMLAQDQGSARFLIAGSLAGDTSLILRRAQALVVLARALEDGAPPLSGETLPAPFGGEAVVGAIASILHARVLEQPVPLLTPLCGSLMGVIVLPYLGVAAVRRELARVQPESRPEARARLSGTASSLPSIQQAQPPGTDLEAV